MSINPQIAIRFKLSTFVALLAVAAPALADNAGVAGLHYISSEAVEVTRHASGTTFTSPPGGIVSLDDPSQPLSLPTSGVY